MQPTTVDGDTTYGWGKLHYLEPSDNNIRLADSDERGVFRDNAEWNDKAFVCDHGRVILDIHEWEDDDTDYEQEDAPAGKIYYNIYSYEGGQWVEEDGGVMAYEFRETLGDWLWNTLGITAEDFCD